jgi:hypothetical protein
MPPAKKKATSGTAPKKSTAAAKPAAAKKSDKSATPATSLGGVPMGEVAAAVARMISARAAGKMPQAAELGAKESAIFKQMKENLANPHASAVDNILNDTAGLGTRPGDHPMGGPKQVGHNQTFNADVTRRNLPRRTGGG